MAQSVADILGCPLDYATSLLEAAGGDPSMAIELGLGGGGTGTGGETGAAGESSTGGGGAPPASSGGGFVPPYSHYAKVWPELVPLPEAWKNQRLDSFSSAECGGGIVQPLNGPCGVLAVVQAEIWLQQQQQQQQQQASDDEERLTTAIRNILSRILKRKRKDEASSPGTAQEEESAVVTMADESTMSLEDASKRIRTATALVEAAASTYGPEKLTVRSAAAAATTLVEGPHWLCSSDLMSLLLRGTVGKAAAAANFGAYDPATKNKIPFYDDPDVVPPSSPTVGVLSMLEIDEGIPVADDLKFGKSVWVVHTGDHFLTMRRRQNGSGSGSGGGSDRDAIHLEVYDGLVPGGPATKTYAVKGDASPAERAPETHVESFRKKRTGQPDDIVQAKKVDGAGYSEWTFEVVPAVDDPEVQGALDEDPDEPIFDFRALPAPEGKWRCASCYANRFKTMNFGTNEAGAASCGVCALPVREAMWSLWLPYADLSPRMKRRARIMYAPKLELLIGTLYPKADIEEVPK